MLGFGIGEIILIVIVAIIVLGPDKLPNALIEMAKFIRVVKKTMQDAKETIDREVNLAEIKREAQAYKEKLEQSTDISKELKDANLINEIQKDMNDIQHLFQDYQPKPINLDEQSQNETANTSKDPIKDSTMDSKMHNTFNVATDLEINNADKSHLKTEKSDSMQSTNIADSISTQQTTTQTLNQDQNTSKTYETNEGDKHDKKYN